MKGKPSERRLRVFAAEFMTRRPCGECQACCQAIAVHEIGKPMAATCPHQCGAGCGIYAKRPGSCRDYACAYKAEWMPDDVRWRPDHLRAIIDIDRAADSRHYVRVWQLDSATAILDDPMIRLAAYRTATQLVLPVVAYHEDKYKSVHLIARLSHWQGAFQRRFPALPVYPLFDPGDLT